jgi:hypothetical protein
MEEEIYVIITALLVIIIGLLIVFLFPKNQPKEEKYRKIVGVSDCSSLNITKEQYLEDEKNGIIDLCEGDPLFVKNFTITRWINDTSYEWEALIKEE